MVEIKTKKTAASVADFIAAIKDPGRRKDCKTVAAIMAKATGQRSKMWGSSIVGFGDIHVKGASREVDWFPVGFSPRKQALTIYLGLGMGLHTAELKKLGRHKRGLGCLYLRSLDDIDLKVLKTMIVKTVKSKGGVYSGK